MEEWVGGGMLHRCDGVTCTIWRGTDGKYHNEERACPGGCKQVGRLKIILPELHRLAYVTVLTTSKHDILNLSAQLQAYEQMRGDLRGVPFVLCRRKKLISTPGNDGKRVRREKWLLSIEPSRDWVTLQLEATRQAALPQPARAEPLALPAPAGEPAPDATDWVEAETEDEQPDYTQDPHEEVMHEEPKSNGTRSRPYPPATLKAGIDQRVARSKTNGELCSEAQRGLLVRKLEECFAPDPEATLKRHSVLKYLTGNNSAKLTTKAQASALLDWLIEKDPVASGDYPLRPHAASEAMLIVRAMQEAAGQTGLPGMEDQ